ncbi:hypothetical protein [Natronorubrum sulfidifaciens]|uniref:OB-fold tRNA/helicase-type nucleic acid binding protein n=1 Tax=Natronorubrum sulfidifaciens JCM 14089 TaxID=1230460 RepID=L9W856_9EURY|nr:hypothetical protein [Natronorubrum sulfidifaciens]ELY45700.1 OB-fold tRNA/helicase-type nucleic acid binding protein [Natronorubrum sulfidifaciens JCM 14089]
MRLAVRLAIVALSLTALLGLCVHYGATYDDNWPHPTGDQLRDDYDAYAGERVLLIGDVQAVDGDTLEVHITDSADRTAADLEVHAPDTTVDSGGTVQVYGVLEADQTVTTADVVVVNPDSHALYYKLGVSVVGVLLAIGYLFRHWRIDPRTLALEPRPTDTTNDG